MRLRQMKEALVFAGVLVAAVEVTAAGAQAPAWASSVDAAFGRPGTMQPGGVYKVSFPRSDLRVAVGDVQLKPALALGAWIAFLQVGRTEALAMGDLILGHPGKLNGLVYQVSVPRAETIRMEGQVIPPSMGVATAINFQPTGGGRAVATGDFVLLGSEVNRVIRALRSHDLEVTAVHSHMLNESPRLFFMHFWGNGDADAIAQGLRSALDLTNSGK